MAAGHSISVRLWLDRASQRLVRAGHVVRMRLLVSQPRRPGSRAVRLSRVVTYAPRRRPAARAAPARPPSP
jgi:hypothetical protein